MWRVLLEVVHREMCAVQPMKGGIKPHVCKNLAVAGFVAVGCGAPAQFRLQAAHHCPCQHASLPPPLRPPQVDDAEWQRLANADFSTAAATASLALPERWVVGALHRTVADITAAHER